MKSLRKFVGIISAVLLIVAYISCQNESSDDSSSSNNSGDVNSAANVTTVSTNEVAGKSFSLASPTRSSSSYTIVFGSDGTTGSIMLGDSSAGTIAYDGDVLVFTTSSRTENYSLRHVNDEIRLLETDYYVKENGQNGFCGKWIYEKDGQIVKTVVVESNGTLTVTSYTGATNLPVQWKVLNGLIMIKKVDAQDFSYCGWVYDDEMHVWQSKYVLVIIS